MSIVCQLEYAKDYDSYLGFQDSRCSNMSVTTFLQGFYAHFAYLRIGKKSYF